MLDVIKERRSIRKYKTGSISENILHTILEAGQLAPSGKNKQPWKFIVFGGKQKEALLSQMAAGLEREAVSDPLLPDSAYGLPDATNTLKIMQNAPIIVVVLNTDGKSPFEPLNADERFTEIVNSLSIGAAVENILLQAQALKIGALWIANTCFAYPELTEFLKENGQLTGAIALGIADEKPAARPRKPFNEIVEYRLS